MDNNSEKMTLRTVKILYVNKKDEKFKSNSLTFWLPDEKADEVARWLKANNLKDETIKEYHYDYNRPTILIMTCKLRHDTEIFDTAGQQLRFEDLTSESIISATIRPYKYNSKEYGSGVSCYLSSIMVLKAKPSLYREDGKELLDSFTADDFYKDNSEDAKKESDPKTAKDKNADFSFDDIPF